MRASLCLVNAAGSDVLDAWAADGGVAASWGEVQNSLGKRKMFLETESCCLRCAGWVTGCIGFSRGGEMFWAYLRMLFAMRGMFNEVLCRIV